MRLRCSGDVLRDPSAGGACQRDVRSRSGWKVSRVAFDAPRAGRAAKWGSGAVARNERERLGRVVRERTRLAHSGLLWRRMELSEAPLNWVKDKQDNDLGAIAKVFMTAASAHEDPAFRFAAFPACSLEDAACRHDCTTTETERSAIARVSRGLGDSRADDPEPSAEITATRSGSFGRCRGRTARGRSRCCERSWRQR